MATLPGASHLCQHTHAHIRHVMHTLKYTHGNTHSHTYWHVHNMDAEKKHNHPSVFESVVNFKCVCTCTTHAHTYTQLKLWVKVMVNELIV